ncbi:MAG TPA: DNA repair protein RecN [Alphaproteobacteria bacterium]
MLVRLSIRNVVLIERLDIDFGPGLCVLTGETGAGKSILLDALGLALGRRAEAGLVGAAPERASAAASFEIDAGHPARRWLAEHGLDDEGALVLRRALGADGRSRAFINDQPVTVAALAELGALLVEVYGQHDRLGLMDPATHRRALDSFGGLEGARVHTAAAHRARVAAEQALAVAEADAAAARARREEIEAVVADLRALAPVAGEEQRLAEERAALMARGRIGELLGQAAELVAGSGRAADEALRGAQRLVAQAAAQAAGRLEALAAAFERAVVETAEALALLDAAGAGLDAEPGRLDAVEERLFALRAAARRHGVAVDALPELARTLADRLEALAEGDAARRDLAEAAVAARAVYDEAAAALSRGRAKAAKRLDRAMGAELAGLKLAAAGFATRLEPLAEARRGATGAERISFEVATNPGLAPGALSDIASGGELSRFMLALCVVLADSRSGGALIFDEIDAGIGGAVADAVGRRLGRLAGSRQVLVVTHQPQVAALADRHLRVVKSVEAGRTLTRIEALDSEARREEIARMLAGAEITDQARAAADSLLDGRAERAAAT